MFTPEQAQIVAQAYAAALENEFQCTKKVLAAVPEKQLDFKLGEKGRTAREIMLHIIGSEQWFAKGILAGDFSMPEGEPKAATVAEMVAWYDRTLPPLLAQVKALSGEQLAKPVQFFNMTLPNVAYLGFWNSHSIHHRAQLSTYLRAMNAHVPSIYGGSADEPFEMESGAQA